MKPWLKEFLHQLTGYYSDRVITCRSYSVVQYLKLTNYKPTMKYTKRRKSNGNS